MDEVERRFLWWFVRFTAVSLLLILVAHFVGRRLRRVRPPSQGSEGKPTAQEN